MKNRKLTQSFRNAFNGLRLGLKQEKNMRIHLISALVIFLAGIILELDVTRWAILVVVIAIVIAAELFNTAIENVVDMITKEYSEKAKLVKDTAAAAVLIASIAAVAVGLLVLSGPILELIKELLV